jgi:hypothetical protein
LNTRYAIPAAAAVLLLPYLLASYPQRAIYAIPNKVWFYEAGRVTAVDAPLFANGKTTAPKYCFPVRGKTESRGAGDLPSEILAVADRCFVFAGRMKPETWPQNILRRCQTIDVFQAKKMRTNSSEWDELFRLFGYNGKVAVRKFFIWYGDKSAACVKEPL